jgi:hypothetical protein
LDGKPSISERDAGFRGLQVLYSKLIRNRYPKGGSIDKIVRFIDARALVPDSRGSVNLVVVKWSHGQQTDTSYEEIREIISKEFDCSVWPLQILLFVIGVCIQLGTIAVTYFPKKHTTEKTDHEIQQNCNRPKEADH